jgi:regulatory protein
MALGYVGRYATTRAKLADYLRRKLRERGWAEGEGAADAAVAAIVGRMADMRYVDDRAFAEARARALVRRGYGRRRVMAALRAAGIEEEDAAELTADDPEAAAAAADAFARRRRIGPYATRPADAAMLRRHLAAMLRAGHSHDVARRVLMTDPGTETN